MIKLYEGSGIYSITLLSGKGLILNEEEFIEIALATPEVEATIEELENKINKLKYQKTKLIDTVDNLNEKIFILKNKNQKLKNKNFEKELE